MNSLFLYLFYHGPKVELMINGGPSMVTANIGEFLALTFKESENEFFFTTCLKQTMVRSIGVRTPIRGLNLHYSDTFQPPIVRNWNPIAASLEYIADWKNKNASDLADSHQPPGSWDVACTYIVPVVRSVFGMGSKTNMYFLDNIPGPCAISTNNDAQIARLDEAEFLANRSWNA